MKKAMVALMVVASAVVMYFVGAMSVLHSEGWIDHERQEFAVEWMENVWVWDISEE